MAKVLLVEDDNNLREIYQARLMAEGYDIVAAQNGEEALVVAKQNKPDLIISDVMMPRISGFEMLDILRNTEGLKHTPVIMLTALGQSEDQKRADNLGADKYLVKSQVTLEDIVAAAKELLAGDGLGTVHTATPATAAPAPGATPAPVAAPMSVVPEPTAAPAPVQATAAAIPVAEPPADLAGPGADVAAPSTPTTPPSPIEPIVPASVVPQPNTTVVVPPAPASPAPPTVTAVETPAPEHTTTAPVIPMPTPEPAAPPTPPIVTPTPAPAPVPTPSLAPISQPLSEEHLAAAAAESAVETHSAGTTLAPTPPDTSSEEREGKAEAAVTDAATQTLEAEEAALQAQIASYANEASDGTPASTPITPAPAVPPVATTPPSSAATDLSNSETINEAVEELEDSAKHDAGVIQPPSIANAPEPAVAAPAPTPAMPTAPPVAATPVPMPTPPPAPAAPPQPPVTPAVSNISSTSDNVNVAGKKVIKPINDPSVKPNIDVLLAKEAATNPAAMPAPVVDGSVVAPQTPGQGFDPNTAL